MWQRVLGGLVDLVSPPVCAACESPLSARRDGFCGACAPLLERRALPAPDARDADACLYGGPLRDALHRFKYAGRSDLAPALAALLLPTARELGRTVDCLTVVPLHPQKLRARGYNQAALLARPLARALGIPFAPRLLARVRPTGTQVGKRRSERVAQLAHAFRGHPTALDRTILLVDDVRTTGATLEAARRVLTHAGARQVLTLALARAETKEQAGQAGCL